MNFINEITKVKPKKDFFNHTYISLRNHYVYTAVGKAANSTVKHYLYELEYTGSFFKTKTLHDRQCSPLLSPFQLPSPLLKEVFTSHLYYRFSMVRNPYTRLLSCYLDRIVPAHSAPYKQLLQTIGKPEGSQISFQEFICAVCKQMPYDQNNHWRLQTSEILASNIEYDFIGKQESFADDMTTIWSHIAPDFPIPNFTSENKAPSITSAAKRLHEFYTPELINMVREAYEEDFITFGYSFNIENC